MSWPIIRATSAPEPAAEVLFDFNAAAASVPRAVLADNFSLGSPSLESAVDAISPAFGSREITFNIEFPHDSKAEALFVVSQAARVLVGRSFWLQVQVSPATAAVWFRIYRARPGDLSLEDVWVDPETGADVRPDRWEVKATFDAEPFAYGERITLPTVTVPNDPSMGGCETVLPPIYGDAPAPLRIEVDPTNSNDTGRSRWMLSVLSGRDQGIVRWEVGSGSPLAFAAGVTTNNTGIGGKMAQAKPDSTAETVRLSGTPTPALPSGRYAIFMRAGRAYASATPLRVGMYQQVGTEMWPVGDGMVSLLNLTDPVPIPWFYLGVLSHPLWHDGPDGVPYSPKIEIRTTSEVAAGNAIYLDDILLMPLGDLLDTRTLYADFETIGIDGGAGRHIFDGDRETSWGYDNAGRAVAGLKPRLSGAFPTAAPGTSNRLRLLTGVNSASGGNTPLTTSTDVTVSYHPRWLYLGDG